MKQGTKHDKNKPRWDLLPIKEVEDVVNVLTRGAQFYADDNWKKVTNKRKRYYAAAMRHLAAWKTGECIDKQFNLPHLAHAICCLLFLMWEDKRKGRVK